MVGIQQGVEMNTAKVFTMGRSQAIRLPKEFRFDSDEVMINKVGGLVVLFPRKKGWDIMAGSLGLFTADFMADRKQPARAENRNRG